MNNPDIARFKQGLDLRELAGQQTTLRRASVRELAGPCPRCGGDDRFHCTATWFFCRQCHPQRGDVIEFVQWVQRVDFAGALALLEGGALLTPLPKPPLSQRAGVQPQSPSPAWRQRAVEQRLGAAQVALLTDAGAAGRAYLQRRGLDMSTCVVYGVGYQMHVSVPGSGGQRKAAAIALPWLSGGKLCAIRYRFLETHAGHKQTAQPGSRFAGHLFGGQALALGAPQPADRLFRRRTLLLCEGEINAMSIWQTAHATRLDVLSLGSESQKLSAAMLDSLRRWGMVLVWADKAETARSQALAVGAHAIQSPNDQDANDLLQMGHLGGFLCAARLRACQTEAERERLLWDLWDAAQDAGVDSGTAHYIRKVASDLGKAVALQEIEPGRWIARSETA